MHPNDLPKPFMREASLGDRRKAASRESGLVLVLRAVQRRASGLAGSNHPKNYRQVDHGSMDDAAGQDFRS